MNSNKATLISHWPDIKEATAHLKGSLVGVVYSLLVMHSTLIFESCQNKFLQKTILFPSISIQSFIMRKQLKYLGGSAARHQPAHKNHWSILERPLRPEQKSPVRVVRGDVMFYLNVPLRWTPEKKKKGYKNTRQKLNYKQQLTYSIESKCLL